MFFCSLMFFFDISIQVFSDPTLIMLVSTIFSLLPWLQTTTVNFPTKKKNKYYFKMENIFSTFVLKTNANWIEAAYLKPPFVTLPSFKDNVFLDEISLRKFKSHFYELSQFLQTFRYFPSFILFSTCSFLSRFELSLTACHYAMFPLSSN